MIKKLLFYLVICLVVPAKAQDIRTMFSGTNKSTKLVLAPTPARPAKPKGAKGKTEKTEPQKDYALYRHVVRRHTWIEGQGEPITQEVANHLPFYYRLSMKNEQGHWQHIEAMHDGELTTAHDMDVYLFNKAYDRDYVDPVWYDRMHTVAQWFITADHTGRGVAEERAYNRDGDMIYSFIPVQNDAQHITGSYNDAWGRPVDMNENSNYTFGDIVRITLDVWGCDSIVEFRDGEGRPKPNTNNVEQQQTVRDAKGRILQTTSHNCIGDRMLDSWGNCGNKYEYAPDGKSYTITRVNHYLIPMRMPEKRADREQTFIKCRVLLDEWGREKERIMLDADEKDDATLAGIHRIVTTYTSNGTIISKTYYDAENHEIQ